MSNQNGNIPAFEHDQKNLTSVSEAGDLGIILRALYAVYFSSQNGGASLIRMVYYTTSVWKFQDCIVSNVEDYKGYIETYKLTCDDKVQLNSHLLESRDSMQLRGHTFALKKS